MLLSHKKGMKFGSFTEMWMAPGSVIQNEVSQKEKNKYRIITHICGIQKNGTDEPICRAEIETQRTSMWTQWGKEGWANWEIRILHIYTAICKTGSQWEATVYVLHTELKSVLCNDLDGWDGGRWLTARSREEGCM